MKSEKETIYDSVSYTHLDVYKRQVLFYTPFYYLVYMNDICPSVIISRIKWCVYNTCFRYMGEDVYKRQEHTLFQTFT